MVHMTGVRVLVYEKRIDDGELSSSTASLAMAKLSWEAYIPIEK
jgi:hypothetical protein